MKKAEDLRQTLLLDSEGWISLETLLEATSMAAAALHEATSMAAAALHETTSMAAAALWEAAPPGRPSSKQLAAHVLISQEC